VEREKNSFLTSIRFPLAAVSWLALTSGHNYSGSFWIHYYFTVDISTAFETLKGQMTCPGSFEA
jgi:hypothetical protein